MTYSHDELAVPAMSCPDTSSPTSEFTRPHDGGPSMRSRQLAIALALGKGGVFIPLRELRRLCRESGCHNEPNFTKNMRTSSLFDEIREGERIVGWRVASAELGPPKCDRVFLPGPAPTDCLPPLRVASPEVFDQADQDRLLTQLVQEENAALRAAEARRVREIEALRAEGESARAEAESMRARVALLESRRVATAPRTVIECIDLVESVFDDRIVFTERARETARSARINELPREMPHVLRCLKAISLHLHDIFFGLRKREPGTPSRKFQECSGFELAMTECHMTKADSRLRSMRKVVFDGEKIDITPHVKYGGAPPKQLRVHIGTHQRTRRLVVGWCGDHMETAGTHRMH